MLWAGRRQEGGAFQAEMRCWSRQLPRPGPARFLLKLTCLHARPLHKPSWLGKGLALYRALSLSPTPVSPACTRAQVAALITCVTELRGRRATEQGDQQLGPDQGVQCSFSPTSSGTSSSSSALVLLCHCADTCPASAHTTVISTSQHRTFWMPLCWSH